MPVRIRLSRFGAKKRPHYRIVVNDSRRPRDGRYIDQIGIYNPMLPTDHPERIKIDVEKAKAWIQKGAQPSDRVHLFLSKFDILDKPVITEKTKKHLPRKKTQERLAKEKEAAETTAVKAKEESSPKEEAAETTAVKAKEESSPKEEKKTNSDIKRSESTNTNANKTAEKKE